MLRLLSTRIALRLTVTVGLGLAVVISLVGMRIVLNEEQDLRDAVRAEMLLLSRSVHPALRGPETAVVLADKGQLAYVRTTGNENILVLVNSSTKKSRFTLDVTPYFREGTLLLDEMGSSGEVTRVTGGFASRVIPALSAAVLVPDRSTP